MPDTLSGSFEVLFYFPLFKWKYYPLIDEVNAEMV
jgi:hypothetical protein